MDNRHTAPQETQQSVNLTHNVEFGHICALAKRYSSTQEEHRRSCQAADDVGLDKHKQLHITQPDIISPCKNAN